MKNLKLQILVSATALLVAGCASAPALKKAVDVPVPTYSEKVEALPVDEVRGVSCPRDNMWEASDWRKIVPLANGCVKAKEWGKVERMGDHLAKKAHLTPWGPYYLSLAAENRKDYPRAMWMLELALKKDPKQGIFHFEMGRIQWEQGDESAALKSLKTASELNPSLTEAHYIMGQMALQRGSNSEAESLLKKALDNDGNHWATLMALAVLKSRTGDWNKAAEYLARAVNQNPRSSRARVALAQIQETHLKRLPEALQSYKAIKQLASARKLDEIVQFNLDEKIKTIEATTREPSSDRKVKK